MKIDPRVHIYDEDDHEIWVDMELLEDGYPCAVYLSGPMKDEDVTLTTTQIETARDKFMLLVDEYESAKADYYSEY
jgi:hypothetical protein